MLRRAFLSRFPAAATLFSAAPQAAPPPAASSRAARHAEDQWLEEAPDKHRAVFDTWMADTFGEALGFASNWMRMNKEHYGLTDGDLAAVLVARHGATPFAFNEAIWTKYGRIFAARMSANDTTAHPNPSTNIYASRLTTLTKQGLRLAVCTITTRSYVQIIAKETGAEQEAVQKELTANAIGNAHFVPAGVIAVTRAQEYGYALVSVG